MAKKITENEAKTVWAKPFEGGIEYEMSKDSPFILLMH